MNSKQALERIRNFEPFGYDNDYKEEYPLSGTLNDYLQEELDTIEKDLDILESIKEKLKRNSDYALMFVDNKFLVVDTTDNKFDIVKELENE